MSAATPHGTTPHYFIPAPSRYPVCVAIGLFLMVLGGSQWVNGHDWGSWCLLTGVVVWLATLAQWFTTAIGESEGGLYSDTVDVSFRWSMSWFIFSEVMFFASFFGALFWARTIALPMLGNLDHQILWPDFHAIWPSAQAGVHRFAGRHHRPVPHHGPVADPHVQHRHPAHLGRHADHRPPRADRQPSHEGDPVDVDHRAAGPQLPVLPGL